MIIDRNVIVKYYTHTQNMGYERFLSHFIDFPGTQSFFAGSGSVTVSKFALDPDPYENDTDPTHCLPVPFVLV